MQAEIGYVRVSLAEVNRRLDGLDQRVTRIGGRLELVEGTP
jgi:hypothetical protein